MAEIRTNNTDNAWCDSYRGPFRFTFSDLFADKENKANITATSNHKLKNDENASSNDQEFKFSFPAHEQAKKARPRKLKLPNFDRLTTVSSQLSSLRVEINAVKQKLDDLSVAESSLQSVQKEIENEVEQWHKRWREWSEDDLIEWIFRIDSGYFKLKQSINANLFDKERFLFQLNLVISRRQTHQKSMFYSVEHFEGKYLIYFDVLDIKQLFGASLNEDDCRKIYDEIQKLMHSEKQAIGKHELCSVCIAQKKDSAMKCGHILCSQCIEKISVCPFCKKGIDKKSIIKIYL